ncbi:hypothetical protein [Paenibacillus hamazuiensis]|uniref:hypothetical protein n=1 Tax=Paenibacillus hamazuiensis TaxID=2936508 RepID=UPI00200EE64A|nr:hypothetical protein [Paenibacillus hamazuiensis]
MIDINTFAEKYAAVWNESDAGRRRKLISELWAEDAEHYAKTLEARGYAELEARIIRAYEINVVEGGYLFKAAGSPDGHHNVVKLGWEMVPKEGGSAAAVGTVFVILGDDGRIVADYQFTYTLPVS